MPRLNCLPFILGLSLLYTQACQAENILVAVAVNFSKPMTEIAAEFNKATGHTAQLSFGSSGKFVSQLENGGPFEVLLSADEKGAQKLENAGLAITSTHFTYAVGKLVLWSAKPGYVDDQGKILATGDFQHLAIGDPKLASYGVAAIETLKNLKLLEKLQPLFVQGENIAQTYQFISTDNAELGFVALSQVIVDGKIGSGSGWIVPSELHSPIRQSAVLLEKAAKNAAAWALLDFLKTPPALEIIKKYGYDLAVPTPLKN